MDKNNFMMKMDTESKEISMEILHCMILKEIP